MSANYPAARTLRDQFEILLFLKGDEYRSVNQITEYAHAHGIMVDRRTIQRWLVSMESMKLVERKGGVFLCENPSPRSCINSPQRRSTEWGWRWSRDSVLRLIAEQVPLDVAA